MDPDRDPPSSCVVEQHRYAQLAAAMLLAVSALAATPAVAYHVSHDATAATLTIS